MTKGEHEKGLLRPTKKLDIDNIQKIIIDALNFLAYSYKQIVSRNVEKWQGEVTRVEVTVLKLWGN